MTGRVTIVFERAGDGRRFMVRGQTARALVALVEAGDRGVTALECSTWALRLAAYCHVLRHDYGLDIETKRETHAGGWHGRHILRTPVTIVSAELEPVDDAFSLPSSAMEGA